MALILRNGGSQSPDRWLKEPRNNQQNKFSSRKLVMEQQMPEENEKLELILSEKLFDLNIEMDNKAPELFVDEMDFLNSYEGEECEHKLEQYIVDQIKGEFR